MKGLRLMSICIAAAWLLCGCGMVSIEPAAAPEAPMVQHAAEETPVPTAAPQNKEFTRGIWQEDVYTSEYAGVTFRLPEGWTKASALELESMTEYSEDGSILNVTELYAQEESGASVLLMVDDLTRYDALQALPAAEYAREVALQLEADEELDLTVTTGETMKLCGAEYACVKAVLEKPAFCQQYLIRRQGDTMVVLILTAPGKEGTEKLMGAFEPQNG